MSQSALLRSAGSGNANESPQSQYLWQLNEEAKKAGASRKDEDQLEDGDATDSDEDMSSQTAESADGDSTVIAEDTDLDDEATDAKGDHEDEEEEDTLVDFADASSELCDGGRALVLCEDVDQAQLAKMLSGRSRISGTASIRGSKKMQTQNKLLCYLAGGRPLKAARTATVSSAVVNEKPPGVDRRRSTTTREIKKTPSKSPSTANTASKGSLRRSSSSTSSTISPTKVASVKTTPSSFSFFSGSKPAPAPIPKVVCVTCLDELPKTKTALLRCKHRMCSPCLKRIFTLATKDPQLMPPKCCNDTAIPIEHVSRLFHVSFKLLYNKKLLEYSTKNRIYCPTKDCGEFIKPKNIETDRATGRKKGTCSKCKTKVCKTCGCAWHGHRDCENDEATKSVLSLGEENGWQRCYRCRTMVQLSEGCNHMKCRCNAEFCMVCAQKWKTCDCSWFNLPPDILNARDYLIPEEQQAVERGLPVVQIRMGQRDRIRDWERQFPAPLEQRIGDIPLPPPFMRQWPPPLSPRTGSHEPMQGPRPHQAEGSHRGRRTMNTEWLSVQEQELIDADLARQLQEAEINEAGIIDVDPALIARRRASRRARRTYGATEDGSVHEL